MLCREEVVLSAQLGPMTKALFERCRIVRCRATHWGS